MKSILGVPHPKRQLAGTSLVLLRSLLGTLIVLCLPQGAGAALIALASSPAWRLLLPPALLPPRPLHAFPFSIRPTRRPQARPMWPGRLPTTASCPT